MPQRNSNGEYIFKDNPEFRPNLSPREIFFNGSFGGTYFRPIYSSITNKNYSNIHKKYPKSWWKGIPDDHLTRPWNEYDKTINKYGVKVGTTLEFWENKGWITKYNVYGWTDWLCGYIAGRRTPDDDRQIQRWLQTAGPNSRFRKWLVKQIVDKNGKWDDYSISPAIRQTLQHWGYQLTLRDFNKIKKESY